MFLFRCSCSWPAGVNIWKWLHLSFRQNGNLNLTQQENFTAGLRNVNDLSQFPRQKQGRAYFHWSKTATWQCIFVFIFIKWVLRKTQVLLTGRDVEGKGTPKYSAMKPPDSRSGLRTVKWACAVEHEIPGSDLLFSVSGNQTVKCA